MSEQWVDTKPTKIIKAQVESESEDEEEAPKLEIKNNPINN